MDKHNDSEILPILAKEPFDNRPYIPIILYDEEVLVLVDSGANVSCIGSLGLNFLRRHKVNLDKGNLKVATTADGTAQKIIGVCHIPVYVNGICKIIKFSVVPSLKCGFILGSDFCKYFSLKIDFENDTWDVRSNRINSSISVVNELPEQIQFSESFKSQLSKAQKQRWKILSLNLNLYLQTINLAEQT